MYSQRGRVKLLLIEDNIGDARIIHEMLREAPNAAFTITHVGRLDEGIRTCKGEEFDVILLDLGLPDSQGFETFYNFKQINEEVPVILLTGLNDEINAIEAVQSGAQDYLNKNELTQGLLFRAIYYAIERQQLLLKLKSKSIRDELTELYNRRGFFEFASKELKLASRVERDFLLIYADLDGLKMINDTWGHTIGDQALIETANILSETFRESDIIARIGGDEFVILAINNSDNSDKAIVERLMKAIDGYNKQENRPYQLSISIGILKWEAKNPVDINEMLRIADARMYNHKQGKKQNKI